MEFFIDTGGKNNVDSTILTKTPIYIQPDEKSNGSEDEEPDIVKQILSNIKESEGECPLILNKKLESKHRNNKNYFNVEEECLKIGLGDKRKKGFHVVHKVTDSLLKETSKVEETLKKSLITSNFECLHQIPSLQKSEQSLKIERKREREKTKGKKWYGLPATEVTEEVKNDLEVLQMRSVLDPKHFYKKNDLKVLPKYFQIGKVVDAPLDYYNNRLTKKERKKTLVDELLANAEFCKFNKRKYKEIIDEKQKTHYKAYKQAKKLKRKNKS